MYDPNTLENVVLEGARAQNMSERAFRERIVIKLLENLGWTEQDDIQFEHVIDVGTSKIRADYLIGFPNNRFILEVKSPGVPISEHDGNSRQTLSYLKLINEALYAVLYNGKKMIIFQKGSDTPIYIWDPRKDLSIFTSLRKENFPFLLDVATGKKAPEAINITQNYGSGAGNNQGNSNFLKSGNDKKLYWTNLRIIGYFSIFSFIFAIVFVGLTSSTNNGTSSLALFFVILFGLSLFAFFIELIRVKLRKLRYSHQN